jgi:hypothetical protein
MDVTVVTFDDWEKVLKASVPPERYHAYREAIFKFRYWLSSPGKTPNCCVAVKSSNSHV